MAWLYCAAHELYHSWQKCKCYEYELCEMCNMQMVALFILYTPEWEIFNLSYNLSAINL